MNKTKTDDSKPEKVNFFELLKQKRALLITLHKEIATQAAVRKNSLQGAIDTALGVRRSAVSQLRKDADAKQKVVKDAHDAAKAKALGKYEESLAAITKERNLSLETLHKNKEDAYHLIHDEFDKLATPHIEKHKTAVKELTEKYEKDEPAYKEATEKLVKAAEDDIKDLEGEIAARRQRSSPESTAVAP